MKSGSATASTENSHWLAINHYAVSSAVTIATRQVQLKRVTPDVIG